MPLSDKGKQIIKEMHSKYGKKKGDEVFYSSQNAGKIEGVEKKPEEKKE